VRGKGRDRLQHVFQGAIGQIAHLESSVERRQLPPSGRQPHAVHGSRRAVDDDDAPGRRLQAHGRLQGPGPVHGQPHAGDVDVELEAGGCRRIDGGEDDRRSREQLGPIAKGDAQRTAIGRDDQVDGAVRVLAPEQLAQLAVRLIAVEEREIEILGVEVHGAGQALLQGRAHGLVEDDDRGQKPGLGVQEQDVLLRTVVSQSRRASHEQTSEHGDGAPGSRPSHRCASPRPGRAHGRDYYRAGGP
jgi:hypothetical protein